MATAESFRWLDILEKEFDKAFVDLDLLIGDLDSDEPEMVYNARKKMATLSSCFAQLTHKAQTIFQSNAKNEAELVNMRAELVEAKTRSQSLEEELHAVLVQLHTTQLQQLNGDNGHSVISQKLQQGLIERSPTHKASLSGINLDVLVMSLENWKRRLELENEGLRHALVSLQGEVCGARLAARYLDKELAGRIQQLQLLGRQDMSGDARDRLWSQLEAEILVQRHKTVMRAVRRREHRSPPPDRSGLVRQVRLTRHPHTGLGISITGGREHGVPILISELDPGGETNDLYVGDSVLSVNGIDLSQASHQEAVNLLSSQTGTVTLRVQYMSNGAEESEEDNDLSNLRYRFFEDAPEGMIYRINGFGPDKDGEAEEEVKGREGGGMLVTPTAPRTPDSSLDNRGGSESSYPSSPSSKQPPTPTPALLEPSPPPASPRHAGVTTLQKIFRSFTPSGVWPEDKVINVDENGADSETNSTREELRVKPNETKAVEPVCMDRVQESETVHVTNGIRRGQETSQLFHPETEAMVLVNGLGDSSFGTPV